MGGFLKQKPTRGWAWMKNGRREWDRTTDHHHVKVVLYH
jgi:hypothetical protein